MIPDFSSFEVNGIPCPMIYIEGGTFEMGSKVYKREQPIRSVTVSSFYIGQFPVIQSLYKSMMGNNPSHFQGANRPVEQVSWDDAKTFVKILNNNTGLEVRLPSEAEWEFAARGGNRSEDYRYSGSDDLKQTSWFKENSGYETKSVGLLRCNELGVFDMCGNVSEWCADVDHDSYVGAPNNSCA